MVKVENQCFPVQVFVAFRREKHAESRGNLIQDGLMSGFDWCEGRNRVWAYWSYGPLATKSSVIIQLVGFALILIESENRVWTFHPFAVIFYPIKLLPTKTLRLFLFLC